MTGINRILAVFLLMSVSAVPLHAAPDSEQAYIEWKPAEGALSYTVEIVDVFDELVLEKATAAPKLEVNLPYGKYRYRVGMLTKFNKVSGWSEWKTLMIVPALEPKILSATPAGLTAGTDTRITIKGKNFYRSSEVTIKNADTALKVKNSKLVDSETISATVDASAAKPGSSYDLIIKNPGDLLDLKAVAVKQFAILEQPPVKPLDYYPGLELCYYSPSLGVKDPYSGSLGVKVFYEFRSLATSHQALSFLKKVPGLYPGVFLSASGFLKPEPDFGSSSMMEAGFYVGYEFSFPLKGDLRWHLSPVIGFKEYFRWHTYKGNDYIGAGRDYFGTRPIIFTGCHVRFDLPKKFFIGLGLEYNLIFEVQPVSMLGVSIRFGYHL